MPTATVTLMYPGCTPFLVAISTVYQDSHYLTHRSRRLTHPPGMAFPVSVFCFAIPTYLDACGCGYPHAPFLVAISVVYHITLDTHGCGLAHPPAKVFSFLLQLTCCPTVSPGPAFIRKVTSRLICLTCLISSE